MAINPVFSVIVPSHNRPGPLAACLASLQAQRVAAGWMEILVVDDGSESLLEGRVPAPRGPAEIRWLRLPRNLGPAAARNEGARAARGAYLAFIDDDCLADRAWLVELQQAVEGSQASAVGGRIVDGSQGSLFGAADQTILDVAYGHYNADPVNAKFFSTSNLAVGTAAFLEVGGFDAGLRTSEDREFSARWLASGRRLTYAPRALVVHAAESGPGRFWSRHFAFGEGAYRFRSRHTRTASNRIRLEPGGFYGRLLLAPFRREAPVRAVGVSALIALSQLASALGFVAARRAAHTSKGRTG